MLIYLSRIFILGLYRRGIRASGHWAHALDHIGIGHWGIRLTHRGTGLTV